MELAGFKLYLAGRSKRTIITYMQLIKRLLKEVPDLNEQSLQLFFVKLLDEGKKASYINRHIITLHIYGDYLKTDKWQALKLLPEETPIKSILSDEEIEQFLAISDGPKWDLFFKTLAFSGMRPGEASHLTRSQIDLGRKLFIADGKTGQRYVPIAPRLLHDLTDYLKNHKGECLFPGNRGTPISRERYCQIFKRRLKQMGIQRPGLTPHSLRHSFITRMLDEDVNLFKVQKIVGHKRSSTTEIYTHFTTKDITEAIKKDPLAREGMPFYDRFKSFRDGVRKLLEGYALSAEEEKEMLDLLRR